MAQIGGLPGGAVQQGGGSIRPTVGEGQGALRPGAQPRIADGSLVEGLVASKDGENYQVRIGSQLLNARSSIPLFIGQRFRAVWDASTSPPMLRLQQADMAVLAKFSGRDQQIAFALLSRGLPVKDEVIWGLRQQWMQNGGDPSKLGVLVELWARGAAMTEGNVALLSWYMELSPNRVMSIWKRIRDRMRARKFASPKELLETLKGGDDEEIQRFLQAHSLAGKPARRGLDPSLLLASAWWPVQDDENRPVLARVSISTESLKGRKAWWLAFEMDGNSIGEVSGDAMTNGRALSANIRLKNPEKLAFVENSLPGLRKELEEADLSVQHLGVGTFRFDEKDGAGEQSLDVEA